MVVSMWEIGFWSRQWPWRKIHFTKAWREQGRPVLMTEAANFSGRPVYMYVPDTWRHISQDSLSSWWSTLCSGHANDNRHVLGKESVITQLCPYPFTSFLLGTNTRITKCDFGKLLYLLFSLSLHPIAGYDLLVHQVSWSHTTTRHSR
jgi:hypothetical protein